MTAGRGPAGQVPWKRGPGDMDRGSGDRRSGFSAAELTTPPDECDPVKTMEDLIIVGSAAENPFVGDITQHMNQDEHYSDLISLKVFLNSEFCPRFLVDEASWDNIGGKLSGKTVLIVSTTLGELTRNEIAMRNFLIARAARDNGASRVILLEPDLFYSAQDRGPRPEHGLPGTERSAADFKKFDGQPFSARLYADLLARAGVDEVVTVHNHSGSVKSVYMDRFAGRFHDLHPADVYADYMCESDIVDCGNLVLCAPDSGALPFAREVRLRMDNPDIGLITMNKERQGEWDVSVSVDPGSELPLEAVEGKDVVVLDDMVRTGKTIIECCRLIRTARPNRVVFFVTHFNSTREGRVNMNDPCIDEIVTTSTIPSILNRDVQGRLRHKMVVLRISKWISSYVLQTLGITSAPLRPPLYMEDMSSKNPRGKGLMGPLFTR